MFKKSMFLLVLIAVFACNQNDKINSIDDLQKRVAKLNEKSNEMEAKRTDVYKLIREFNATQPDSAQFDITSFDTVMGAPERDLLRVMFREEKDITYSGLVKTIVEKNNEIAELKEQVADLHERLPEPYVVKRGDTHYEVVLNYLETKHGLSKNEALKVAWRTMLVDELLPGNEVWLMYNDGIVGSFVTQGSAYAAPMSVHVRAQKKLAEQLAGLKTASQEDSVLIQK